MSADDRTATVPEGYRPLDVASLAPYLAGQPALRRRLGGAPAAWHVEEVGDGNLNLVFLVRGPAGGLAVKQALPYVRLIGESWPLPLDRAFFEHEALVEHGRHAPGLTPAVYHFDPVLMLTAMELLEPHIIMRRGMIQGIRYPRVAADMAAYMARTLFFTSDLGMGAAEKKARVALFCGNTALCKISEDLIFTEPYMVCDNNRWTAPQLDDIAASFRADPALKRAVSRLKCRFMGSAEALIHGDLHTGSIMVTQDETRVIDPEFAFYGPMGFDTGAFVGNLLLNYFSQDGHATPADDRTAYKAWVLETAESFWHGFAERYGALWAGRTGDAYPAALFAGNDGAASLGKARDAAIADLFADTIQFAGAKMIRRLLGIAHNIDFDWIEDPDRRAACERPALLLGRELLTNAAAYPTIDAVTRAARALDPRAGMSAAQEPGPPPPGARPPTRRPTGRGDAP